MTRTRVDSAAKHIMSGKIDSNLMKVYCGGEHADLQTMDQKKLELLTVSFHRTFVYRYTRSARNDYCLTLLVCFFQEKDDLILNVSRKLGCADTWTFHAYPAVVSTLANCTDTYKLILSVLNS
jgi:hypothetical protein